MTRTNGILLGIVGVLVGVLGTLGVVHFTGAGDPTMLEDIPGHESAHESAELSCTFAGVVPGMTGLHDPKYLQCVEDETRSGLVKDGHAEAETAASRLN